MNALLPPPSLTHTLSFSSEEPPTAPVARCTCPILVFMAVWDDIGRLAISLRWCQCLDDDGMHDQAEMAYQTSGTSLICNLGSCSSPLTRNVQSSNPRTAANFASHGLPTCH
jgi:hypothetical protein